VDVRLDRGQTLFHEGDEAKHVFTVTDGVLKLYKLLSDGRRQITGFLVAGAFLGLAYGRSYLFSAEAVTPTRLCRFSRRRFETFATEHPELERELLSVASNELAQAQDQMLLLGRKTARERLATFLWNMAKHQDGEIIMLSMSRADIADYLGLTVETVSRTFTAMRKDSLINIRRSGAVELMEPNRIRALAVG
jgi:CRP/FNR family transcriptional regulator